MHWLSVSVVKYSAQIDQVEFNFICTCDVGIHIQFHIQSICPYDTFCELRVHSQKRAGYTVNVRKWTAQI